MKWKLGTMYEEVLAELMIDGGGIAGDTCSVHILYVHVCNLCKCNTFTRVCVRSLKRCIRVDGVFFRTYFSFGKVIT